MRRIRNVVIALVGMALAITALVAPTGAQAASATGTITVEPGQSITAKFGGIKLDKSRVVRLEHSTDGGTTWKLLVEKKMSSKGAVDFGRVADAAGTYRAVAKPFTYKSKKKKVTDAQFATAPRDVKPLSWSDEFNSLDLDGKPVWRSRHEGGFRAGGRLCAAPVRANALHKPGVAVLRVTEVKDAAVKAKVIADAKAAQAAKAGSTSYTKAVNKLAAEKAKEAAAKSKSAKSKAKKAVKSAQAAVDKLTPGCPSGVYYNAMITTGPNQGDSADKTAQDYTLRAGTLVARVKFPIGQGAHGGIWLRDSDGEEIDVAEAFGYGRGVMGVLWYRDAKNNLVRDPASDSKAYVASSKTKDRKWWSQWHTVSVTFDGSRTTFYLDGVKTNTLRGMTGDFRVMLSNLSSDWETFRIKGPDARKGSGVSKSSAKKYAKKSLPRDVEVDWIRVWEK